MKILPVAAAMFVGASASAAPPPAAVPPHLAAGDQIDYRDYLEAPDHRAFAVAPGGAWGWSAGEASSDIAEEKALADCAGHTEQACVLYGSDGRLVFDAKAWRRLWGPYAGAKEAATRGVGTARGQRFPDLALRDAKGKPVTLASLSGKVVFLHFWGTWCPPCRRELPDLQKLYGSMADRRDLAFVLVQVREGYPAARDWLQREGLRLPLYDSGATGSEDAEFRLAGGGRIADRKVAARFPTTYVLDKRGLVVFSHIGPVADWMQYAAFLRDAADRSGR